jgi:uncharacterized protein YraI
VNGAFRRDAASWPPGRSFLDDGAVRSPRRLGLIFAIVAIAGAALLTAGAVAILVEPSQGAPDKTSAIDADQPLLTASLVPKLLPVRKVVTTPVRVARRSAPQAVASEAAPVEDRDMLEQHDPRWARSDSAIAFAPMMQPNASAKEDGFAATTPVAPHAAKTSPAAEAAVDDVEQPRDFKASTRTVRVNRGVNMRTRPKSGASVLTVVPKAASVQLVGCKLWCEIVYKGRRGYVFNDFVGSRARASVERKSANTAAKETKSTTTTAKETKTVSTSSAQQPALSQPPRGRMISTRLQ